jgi:hypothetical protein
MATQDGRHLALYGGHDPRDLPAYPLDVAASVLLLPKSTLKFWVFGETWTEKGGVLRSFAPLIDPPDRDQHNLSCVNLVEAHVLKSLRKEAIAERFWGGDSIPDLVRDFERTQAEVEYAIRYEYEQLAVAKARREPPREMAA